MDSTIKYNTLDLSNKNLKDLSILKDVKEPNECKILKLNNNDISVIENLEKFENLEELNLGCNNIGEIKGIQTLKKLKELLLYFNKIDIIKNLDTLDNLKRLNLDYNDITEIQGLDHLNNLEELSLTYNKINKIKNLESLKSLKNLILDENPIKEISSLGNLANLKELRIHNNELPLILQKALLINPSDAKVADIEKVKTFCRNEFVQINDEIILACDSPEFEFGGLGLYLGYKNIEDIKSIQNLSNIKNLKGLILFNNNIKDIEGLEALKDLEYLFLSHNKISSIKGLNSLTQLKALEINKNFIIQIENLQDCSNLKKLVLSDNKILEIRNLDLLKNLEIIDLSNNQISEIQGLNNLEQLEYLNLKVNYIEKIEKINSLQKLIEINLSSNKINFINGLKPHHNLQNLDLSNNSIEDITNLATNNKLYYLNLSNNKIENFDILKSFINLRELNLDNNDPINEIIKKVKEISNNEGFAKNVVGYCILKEILTDINDNQKKIIKFEDFKEYSSYLSRFKYCNILPIKNLLTDQYFEFQVGKNHFITSIFTPIYAANWFDNFLENMDIEGSNAFVEYDFLKSELKLINTECIINLIKYIEENNLNKIPFARRADKIIRKKEKSDRMEEVAKLIIIDKEEEKFEGIINNIDTGCEDITTYIKKELNNKIDLIKKLSIENFQHFCETICLIVKLMIKNTETEHILKKDIDKFWEEHQNKRMDIEVDWFQPKMRELFIDKFGIDNVNKESERIRGKTDFLIFNIPIECKVFNDKKDANKRDKSGLELLKEYESQAYQLQKYTRCGVLLGYDYRRSNINPEFLRLAINETFQVASERDKILFKAVFIGNVIIPSQF